MPHPQDIITIFIVSTYTGGTPPTSAEWACQWLKDTVDDCRVQKSLLSNVYYAVFGVGNSLYKDDYNVVGVARCGCGLYCMDQSDCRYPSECSSG